MRKINFKERLDDFWVFPKLTKVKHSGDPDNRFFDFLNENRDSNTPTIYTSTFRSVNRDAFFARIINYTE